MPQRRKPDTLFPDAAREKTKASGKTETKRKTEIPA